MSNLKPSNNEQVSETLWKILTYNQSRPMNASGVIGERHCPISWK